MSQQTYYANPDNLIARADLVPNSLDKLNFAEINPFIEYNQFIIFKYFPSVNN